jgi:cellulose synthase/poly-beta-1,6-N-acetylglucosamine synthase-like glycosyltransferase
MDMINRAQPASDQAAHDDHGLDTLQIFGTHSRAKTGLTLAGANFVSGDRPSLSVVVPCYNEEESIQACHVQLSESLASAGRSYEIVYVNDGSCHAYQ